jgi:hypothetical protein
MNLKGVRLQGADFVWFLLYRSFVILHTFNNCDCAIRTHCINCNLSSDGFGRQWLSGKDMEYIGVFRLKVNAESESYEPFVYSVFKLRRQSEGTEGVFHLERRRSYFALRDDLPVSMLPLDHRFRATTESNGSTWVHSG